MLLSLVGFARAFRSVQVGDGAATLPLHEGVPDNATGNCDRCLIRTLGVAVVAAARTDTFLGERYRLPASRHGKNKAIVAVGQLRRDHRLAGRPRTDCAELRGGGGRLRL